MTALCFHCHFVAFLAGSASDLLDAVNCQVMD